MTMVVVFGGAGFLGRRLVHRLTTERLTVRVAARHPEPARIELRSTGFDWVTIVPADVRDQASVVAAIAGADAVVNTVSAFFTAKRDFRNWHTADESDWAYGVRY